MKLSTFASLAATTALLSACGAPVDEDAETSSGSIPGSSQADYETYNDARDSIDDITSQVALGTAAAEARSDTVELTGIYGIDVDDLLSTDAILGEMSMTADFGNDEISGEMTNNFIAFDDANGAHTAGTVSPLSGTLTYAGTITGDGLEAHFEDTLTTADGVVYSLYVDMTGTFYTISDGTVTELGAIGNFEGNVISSENSTDIYDLTDTYDFDSDGTADTGFIVCETICSGN